MGIGILDSATHVDYGSLCIHQRLGCLLDLHLVDLDWKDDNRAG